MEHLAWPGPIDVTASSSWRALGRARELLARGEENAVYWSPNHRGPLFARRHVVTVLDCINIEYTYKGDWRLPLVRGLFAALVNNATVVVAISHATREAILRNFPIDPDKIQVIAGPVQFDGGENPSAPPPREPESLPFVLMVTNALPHKNSSLAGRAFAASAASRLGIQLRVVGALETEALAACATAKVDVQVHQAVDDETLKGWFRTSQFLFAPSLDEGLDLPVAEALSNGGRVLCSDIPVHREFYDGEVLFCDPLRIDSMTAALNDAFGRTSHEFPAGAHIRQRTFADVAQDYRKLFLRVGAWQ
jgi:glycosyltransferase involved in cell wall biosynthesis